MSRKTKNIDHELCDYDEAYDRESASDIGWCGKCKIPECPYNKDLNEKRRMGWKTQWNDDFLIGGNDYGI